MPRARHIEDGPIPIRLGPGLLASIAQIQKRMDLETRSAAIRLILWHGINALNKEFQDEQRS